MRTMRLDQDQPRPSSACYVLWMIKRTDRMTAFHVDLAVNLAGSHGVHAGARAMFEAGLPIELAQRVLLRPGQRRGTTERSQPGRLQTAG